MKILRYILPITLFALLSLNSGNSMVDFINKSKFKVIQKIEDKNTYHMNSLMDLHGGWTCGFFTLFNAYQIERKLGIIGNLKFKELCEKYIIPKKIDPTDGTYADDLVNIAENCLGLHNYYGLHFSENGVIEPLLKGIHIKWNLSTKNKDVRFKVDVKRDELRMQGYAPYKTSKDQLKQLFNKEKNNQLQNMLLKLKSELNAVPANKAHTIHFVCEIPEKVHWILISVVKNPFEKPVLFVFDNMNYKISSIKSTQKYIKQINEMFCV